MKDLALNNQHKTNQTNKQATDTHARKHPRIVWIDR